MIRRESAADTTQHSSSYPLTDLGSRQSQPPPIPCTEGDRGSSESEKGILGHDDRVEGGKKDRIRKQVVYEVAFAEGNEPQRSMRGW